MSNRLTSGYAANTNKTYGGKSSYAMYFMPYIVDSVATVRYELWKLERAEWQSPVQQFRDLLNASVLLFGRTIKYCVTNIGRKFPTSFSTLSYKTPVLPTYST